MSLLLMMWDSGVTLGFKLMGKDKIVKFVCLCKDSLRLGMPQRQSKSLMIQDSKSGLPLDLLRA